MKLYNVTVRVVDLVWATSEDVAVEHLRVHVEAAGLTALRDTGDNAFVSEPLPDFGWNGDPGDWLPPVTP